MAKYDFDGVENTVEKEDNAGDQHFIFFQQCFKKATFSGLCCKHINHFINAFCVKSFHIKNTQEILKILQNFNNKISEL